MKHTKGNWHAAGQAIYSGEIYIAQCWDETSRELPEYADALERTTVPDNAQEAQANAKLLAAAPELLDDLRDTRETMGWVKQWLLDLEQDSRIATRHIVSEIDKALARAAIAKATVR